MEKYWIGLEPTECDLNKCVITTTFIDGRTKFGPWANLCPKCHKKFGIGLGAGKGQQYQKQVDGKWLKTKG